MGKMCPDREEWLKEAEFTRVTTMAKVLAVYLAVGSERDGLLKPSWASCQNTKLLWCHVASALRAMG